MVAEDHGGGFGEAVEIEVEATFVLAEALGRRVRQARQAVEVKPSSS